MSSPQLSLARTPTLKRYSEYINTKVVICPGYLTTSKENCMKNMKKYLTIAIKAATVVVVAVFLTSWVNILVPTFWKQEVLDAKLIFGLSVRSIITFLVIIIPCILLKNRIDKHTINIWLSMCLLFMVAVYRASYIFLSILAEDSSEWLALENDISMAIYVLGMGMFFEFVLIRTILRQTKYSLMDMLFSISLAFLTYVVTVGILRQPIWGANTYGAIFPTVGFLQILLAKKYKPNPKKSKEQE